MKLKMKSNQFGFTVIELLMVIVILAILAAMAIISFARSAGSATLDSYQYQVVQKLNRARTEALARNTDVEVVFTTTDAGCEIRLSNNNNQVISRKVTPSAGNVTCTVVNTGNTNKVIFNNKGLVTDISGTTPATITLSHAAAGTKTIQIYGTGYSKAN